MPPPVSNPDNDGALCRRSDVQAREGDAEAVEVEIEGTEICLRMAVAASASDPVCSLQALPGSPGRGAVNPQPVRYAHADPRAGADRVATRSYPEDELPARSLVADTAPRLHEEGWWWLRAPPPRW